MLLRVRGVLRLKLDVIEKIHVHHVSLFFLQSFHVIDQIFRYRGCDKALLHPFKVDSLKQFVVFQRLEVVG